MAPFSEESRPLLDLIESCYGPSVVLRCVHPMFNTKGEYNSWCGSLDTDIVIDWCDIIDTDKISDLRNAFILGYIGKRVYSTDREMLLYNLIGCVSNGKKDLILEIINISKEECIEYKLCDEIKSSFLFLSLHHAIINFKYDIAYNIIAASHDYIPVRLFSPTSHPQYYKKYLCVFEPVSCNDNKLIDEIINRCIIKEQLGYLSLCNNRIISSHFKDDYYLETGGFLTLCLRNLLVCDNFDGALTLIDLTKQHKGWLTRSANTGWVRLCDVLIKEGADVNDTRTLNVSPLVASVYNGHMDVIECLIDKANVNLKDCDDNSTALHVAAIRQRTDIIERLIHCGARVNDTMIYGVSALHLSSQKGDVKSIQVLIKHNADLNSTDSDGTNALYLSCRGGHLEAAEVILREGGDVTVRSNIDGSSCLHLASERGHTSLVRTLIKHNAYVDARDDYGRTPLYMSCLGGHEECVSALIEAGADVRVESKNRMTPLRVCVLYGWSGVEGRIKAGGSRDNFIILFFLRVLSFIFYLYRFIKSGKLNRFIKWKKDKID
eukprot:GHVR01127952.1.p1 GENE.GHVR01127952.1~~GHVR01127952.1.p1  ORF type:complete len:566 (+),score=112.35 GHVR01127952.1:53-1699(+)